ncbi:hypothetical protein J4727_18180 [Providencia rettgeri]|uniref:Uncharacterized protein n=1 Tax=Providencia rettgeri TaxID=587 RepID=A0A939SPK2_PRORE|nr:hypothetical protein [Providencia rettgeri]
MYPYHNLNLIQYAAFTRHGTVYLEPALALASCRQSIWWRRSALYRQEGKEFTNTEQRIINRMPVSFSLSRCLKPIADIAEYVLKSKSNSLISPPPHDIVVTTPFLVEIGTPRIQYLYSDRHD